MLRRSFLQPSISSFKIKTQTMSNPTIVNNFCFISAAGSHAKFKQSAWSGSGNTNNDANNNNNNNNTNEQQQQQQSTNNNSNNTSGGGSCGSGGCGGCGGGAKNNGSKPNSDNGTVYDDHARYLGFRNALANMSRAATNCDLDVAKTSPVPLDTFEIRRQQFIHEKLVSQAVQTQLLLSRAGDTDRKERERLDQERRQNFHHPYSTDHANMMRTIAERDKEILNNNLNKVNQENNNYISTTTTTTSQQIANLTKAPIVKDPLDRFPGIISTGGVVAPKYEPPAGSSFYTTQQLLLADRSLEAKRANEKQKWKNTTNGDQNGDDDLIVMENDLSSVILQKQNGRNQDDTRAAMLLDPSLRKKGPHALKKELEERVRQVEIDSKRRLDALQEQDDAARILQEKRLQVEATRHARRAAVEATHLGFGFSAGGADNSQVSQQRRAAAVAGILNSNAGTSSLFMLPSKESDSENDVSSIASPLRSTLPIHRFDLEDDLNIISPLSPEWGRRRKVHPVDVLHHRIAAEIRRELQEFEHRQARTFMSTRLRNLNDTNNNNDNVSSDLQ